LKIPSGEEAVCIMKRAGCGQPIIEHCIGVTRIALELAEELRRRGMEIDMRLVEAGAMLHDIGRCRTHSVEHGAIGGQMAREMGLPEQLARIIERHVGGGITQEEAERLGLVRGNYIPETLEEKVVAYADKLIEGDRRIPIEETIRKFEEELGAEHPAIERLRALHEEMLRLITSGEYK
jgi:uncharacterized protein